MNRKAFTLVELLAVIVILAIILAVAVPSISDVITNSKNSAYDSQVKIILTAAKKHFEIGGNIPASGKGSTVTVSTLQSEEYLSLNIKDPITGNSIPGNKWIAVFNRAGVLYYYYDYVKDGLILQYDGEYNGGMYTHNDNISASKGTWVDISGNNRNGTLTSGFGYTASSGWNTKYLTFDGTDDIVNVGALSLSAYTAEFAVLLTKTTDYNGLLAQASTIGNALALGPHSNNALFYFGNASSDTSLVSYGSSSAFTTATYVRSDSTTRYGYNSGVAKTLNGTFNSAFPTTALVLGNCTWGYLKGNLYNVRIYSRVLSATEVKQNAEIDTARFGL